MKYTGLNEIREKYLAFFESKSHTRLKSFPLVPIGDNSLLLINSGMAPMKKFFLGQETPPNTRVTTCQKCIRTPDIENVGKTARHGTFFEMLGNFSFGDYFKTEAIKFAWEFCVEIMEMPVDKLWITIYQDDDEAFDIWTKVIGLPPERIVRMGKEDNFWEHGSGPCGPCSEIYFDRGEHNGCGSPNCAVGCECDRFVEFWNLVFSQFDSDGNGNYAALAKPNIDTGMGLERLACIMQDVDNLFEVDTVKNIMEHISNICNVTYKQDSKVDVSLRVITDHIRSTTFMIADGVSPSNEGRGYVLRRLLRRAARHGRLLSVARPFLFEVVDTVINESKAAYPELEEKRDYIKKMVKTEEESFNKTIDKGFELLNRIIDKNVTIDMKDPANQATFSGDDAFLLYDTFGFPIDLTKEILAERNIAVDEDKFTELMNLQRMRARAARGTGEAFGSNDIINSLSLPATTFVGYDTLQADSEVLTIIVDNTVVTSAHSLCLIITKVSPFYAESGGQVGDVGMIKTDHTIANVLDVHKNNGVIIHYCEIENGTISTGDKVFMNVAKDVRAAITRNHTTAHILQAALIEVLGSHVHQAGQLVNPMRLRFDFSHFEALTKEQLHIIERKVNSVILQNMPVNRYETDIKSAKQKGAMALFGEKYGDIVRVCEVGDYSLELCGGTHVSRSGDIGLFKIVSESSVAAGVRRIEGVTGLNLLALLNESSNIINHTAEIVKSSGADLVSHCEQIMNEIKSKNVEIDRLTQKLADTNIEGLFDSIQNVCNVNYITTLISSTKPDALKIMGDKIKEKAPNMIALLATIFEGKGTMLCVCGSEAVKKGANAGKIVCKASAIAGGKGGGRPDTAMAGIADNHKIDEAFEALPSIITEILSK